MELAAAEGVRLALLNGRMSSAAFLRWFQRPLSRSLLERIISRFTLIVPQSDIVGGRGRHGALYGAAAGACMRWPQEQHCRLRGWRLQVGVQ